MKMSNKRALILDRDGVINERKEGQGPNNYVLSEEDLVIYEDFYDLARMVTAAKLDMFVATNQQAVSKKFISETELGSIHSKIQDSLEIRNLSRIKEFFVCTHAAESCECRKPLPGLILQIIEKYGFKRDELVFLGDTWSDYQAAAAAGIDFVQVSRGAEAFSESVVLNLSDIFLEGEMF